ncbi:MAG: hypothetical protein ACKVIG_07880 [Flavobacteriales bacterium]
MTEHVDAHPHLQCLEWGKVDCLTVDMQIAKISNREITASQILIQGKCETCNV